MITLRKYQETLVDQLRQSLKKNNRTIGVSPTGSGKRMVACWLMAQMMGNGRRVAVATDRRTLVTQMGDECREHDISYGLRMGDSPRNDHAAAQICSIQTLQARKWKDLPPADCWIIDEAHKASHAYKQLLSYYPDAKVISFTATPVGRNGCSLVSVLGPLVEPYRNTDLISLGWLLPTRVFAPSEPDLKGVTVNSGGEYSQLKLGKRVSECTVFADVFRWWAPYQYRQTICFVPRVKFAYGLAEQFNDRGHSAAVVEGKTSHRERQDIFARFAACQIRVLINVGVLVEGYDCPIASVGLDLTPNNQFRNFWQKVGRIRRPHPGQEEAIWFDFSGNIWKFAHPDDNPEWPTDDNGLANANKNKRDPDLKDRWSCRKCGYVLASWEKMHDGICPGCNTKAGKPIRRIRMGDGTMREVDLHQHRQRKNTPEQQAWASACYKAHHSNQAMSVAAYIYEKEMGSMPASSLWPKPPELGSPNWGKKPRELYQAFNR